MIDEDLPVVGVATGERVFDKVASNFQEVRVRDGEELAVVDRDAEELVNLADEIIGMTRVSERLQPIVNVIPHQQLAYLRARPA